MISDPRNPAAASTLGPTPWPSQIYERLLCLPKKFEGHGSAGEVETVVRCCACENSFAGSRYSAHWRIIQRNAATYCQAFHSLWQKRTFMLCDPSIHYIIPNWPCPAERMICIELLKLRFASYVSENYITTLYFKGYELMGVQ